MTTATRRAMRKLLASLPGARKGDLKRRWRRWVVRTKKVVKITEIELAFIRKFYESHCVMKTLTDANKEDIRNATLEKGEALLLINGEITVGRDGCQPSNSSCIAVGPWSYADSDITMEEIEEAL